MTNVKISNIRTKPTCRTYKVFPSSTWLCKHNIYDKDGKTLLFKEHGIYMEVQERNPLLTATYHAKKIAIHLATEIGKRYVVIDSDVTSNFVNVKQ